MVKRMLTKDSYALENLRLGATNKPAVDAVLGTTVPFRLGLIPINGTKDDFEPLESTNSLEECGISWGSVIYVWVDESTQRKK